MGLQTADKRRRRVGGGGGGFHFEGRRGEQTCGRKDLKDRLEIDGEAGGVISSG